MEAGIQALFFNATNGGFTICRAIEAPRMSTVKGPPAAGARHQGRADGLVEDRARACPERTRPTGPPSGAGNGGARPHDPAVAGLEEDDLPGAAPLLFGEQGLAADEIGALVQLHRPAEPGRQRRDLGAQFMAVERVAGLQPQAVARAQAAQLEPMRPRPRPAGPPPAPGASPAAW